MDRTQKLNRPWFWAGAAMLMAVPVIILRRVEGEAGDPGDFVFLLLLLLGLGGAFEAAIRVNDRNAYRAGFLIAATAALLHIWINLAVGIIGSENNPANLIYVAVIAVAALGAVLARFHAGGMAVAMAATAAAQLLAFLVALLAGLGFTGPITLFFAGLWLISAWLFRRAHRSSAAK